MNTKYMLNVSLNVKGSGIVAEPEEHVADAVRALLDDYKFDWLLEAIGHPDAEDLEIEVASIGVICDKSSP